MDEPMSYALWYQCRQCGQRFSSGPEFGEPRTPAGRVQVAGCQDSPFLRHPHQCDAHRTGLADLIGFVAYTADEMLTAVAGDPPIIRPDDLNWPTTPVIIRKQEGRNP
jgi:hypothetical protein